MEQKKTQITIAFPTDRLISGERFSVVLDRQRGIAQTAPFPPAEKLSSYYASEDYISHTNRKESLSDHLYGLVQKLMFFQKKRWLLPYWKTQATYLDYGCGTGAFVRYLNLQNVRAFGVEPNQKARKRFNQQQFVKGSLDQISQVCFQTIALWHVLEHLPAPEKTLRSLLERLSHGGALFLALPNFMCWDAKYYGDDWAAYDVPRHLWHFSPVGIETLCKSLGLRLVKKKPLFFDAFYVCYLSEKHKGKRFPLLRGFCVGLISNLMGCLSKNFSSHIYVFSKAN